jgi:hypothetical protein
MAKAKSLKKAETLQASQEYLNLTMGISNDASISKSGYNLVDVKVDNITHKPKEKGSSKVDIREWINNMRQTSHLTDKQRSLLAHRESRNTRKRRGRTAREPPRNDFLMTFKAK